MTEGDGMTPRARILKLLVGAPGGLTDVQLYMRLHNFLTVAKLQLQLSRLVETDRVWRLPVRIRDGRELSLYFLPDKNERRKPA